MILTYAEIADTAARKREPVVSPLILTAGYVAVWLGFALAAALLQWRWRAPACSMAAASDGWSAARSLSRAGLYQFSALKQACLTLCQRPFPFFFSNWTTERERRVSARVAAGHALSRLLLGDDAADVRGRRNERGVDGGAGRADDDREARPRRRDSARRWAFAFVAVGFGMVVSSVV